MSQSPESPLFTQKNVCIFGGNKKNKSFSVRVVGSLELARALTHTYELE